MAFILILTYLIKRKWQSIVGLIIDLALLCYQAINVIDLFNVPEGDEALGYAIGLSMFGTTIIILFIAMIAVTVAQAFTIKKYGKKVN